MNLHTNRLRLGWVFLLIVLLSAASSARADGKFFGEPDIGDDPQIRAQRGLVAFRGGIETLIVQSDIEQQGAELGWILPVPAEPTAIEPCHSNALRALAHMTEPEVKQVPALWGVLAVALAVLLLAARLEYVRGKVESRPLTRTERALAIIVGIFLLVVVCGICLPSLSMSRGGSSDVSVLRSEQVGVYDVSVIKGKSGAAVTEWLKANGFAAGAGAETVFADYVKRGWCFLAAQVAAEAGAGVTHHPLKVTFATSTPVYPLRLTGVDAEPLQLDLHVIGEKRAAAKHLRVWTCDRYGVNGPYQRFSRIGEDFREFGAQMPTTYGSAVTELPRIGIPDVADLMWPGCVVTRLHGRLNSADMRSDLTIGWEDTWPTRATVCSWSTAASWSVMIGSAVIALSFLLLSRPAVRQKWTQRELIRRRLPAALLLGLIVGGGVYAWADVVPVKWGRGFQFVIDRMALQTHQRALDILDSEPMAAGSMPEIYHETLKECGAEWDQMKFGPELEKVGDYYLEQVEGGWRLTIIDKPYVPITIMLDEAGRPMRDAWPVGGRGGPPHTLQDEDGGGDMPVDDGAGATSAGSTTAPA